MLCVGWIRLVSTALLQLQMSRKRRPPSSMAHAPRSEVSTTQQRSDSSDSSDSSKQSMPCSNAALHLSTARLVSPEPGFCFGEWTIVCGCSWTIQGACRGRAAACASSTMRERQERVSGFHYNQAMEAWHCIASWPAEHRPGSAGRTRLEGECWHWRGPLAELKARGREKARKRVDPRRATVAHPSRRARIPRWISRLVGS
ncbi:hypothetical protein BD289DRAFT_159034 [Coniella lustricola]|uniref:Uncharacterized protein n=1 Tax=Coniella lustricola TaxID=2025994 RepID=A0A2T3AEH4_9PEZI|nr:hypothetical protein BD289DRAFT_159034 [Coniella lustricola]